MVPRFVECCGHQGSRCSSLWIHIHTHKDHLFCSLLDFHVSNVTQKVERCGTVLRGWTCFPHMLTLCLWKHIWLLAFHYRWSAAPVDRLLLIALAHTESVCLCVRAPLCPQLCGFILVSPGLTGHSCRIRLRSNCIMHTCVPICTRAWSAVFTDAYHTLFVHSYVCVSVSLILQCSPVLTSVSDPAVEACPLH